MVRTLDISQQIHARLLNKAFALYALVHEMEQALVQAPAYEEADKTLATLGDAVIESVAAHLDASTVEIRNLGKALKEFRDKVKD